MSIAPWTSAGAPVGLHGFVAEADATAPVFAKEPAFPAVLPADTSQEKQLPDASPRAFEFPATAAEAELAALLVAEEAALPATFRAFDPDALSFPVTRDEDDAVLCPLAEEELLPAKF